MASSYIQSTVGETTGILTAPSASKKQAACRDLAARPACKIISQTIFEVLSQNCMKIEYPNLSFPSIDSK